MLTVRLKLMDPAAFLTVQRLSKAYQIGAQTLTVLNGVSFSVPEGTACAILGPSGSGKTTLLALCAGLERPSGGSVTVNGCELNRLSEDELARFRNQHVGFVFQTFQLISTLTALENVMIPAELRGTNQPQGLAMDLLKQVGLEDRLHHYPLQLSGGEQQRVAIARAFINRPKVLFADEPTGNLDSETGATVTNLLFELNKLAGTTLLLVTHDVELAQRAQRVIRLKSGAIISDSDGQQAL